MPVTKRKQSAALMALVVGLSFVNGPSWPGALASTTSLASATVPLDANGYVLANLAAPGASDPLRSFNFVGPHALEVGHQTTANESVVQVAYVRFSLSADGTTLDPTAIVAAKLRLYVNSTYTTLNQSSITVNAQQIREASWSESTLDYNNAPIVLSNLSMVSIGKNDSYYSWDVTNATRGVAPGGEVTVALAIPVSQGEEEHVLFNSRQATTNRPEVLLVFGETGTGLTTVQLAAALTVGLAVAVLALVYLRRRRSRNETADLDRRAERTAPVAGPLQVVEWTLGPANRWNRSVTGL